MRVLMTTDCVGGVWTFTQELVSGLLEQECEIALFSLGGPLREEQRAWTLKMEKDWAHNFCFRGTSSPLEWMQANDLAFATAATDLLSLAREFQPDVLHSNQFCFGALPLSIPKIVTAHSDVLSWAASCRDTPLEDSHWLREYRSLVKAGLDRADAVVTPTRWILTALCQHFELPGWQLVIPNGRQIDAPPQRHRRLQAVTAGRLWDEAKNITTLSNVGSPIHMLVAGETSCEQQTAPTLPPTVEFMGALSQQALLALFRESAIYICTSKYEPFGLAPLEAALCGCAVLVNDIPSLREVWGDAALYFTDTATLSQLLADLYADDELLATAQARSLGRARTYSREAMTLTYLATYEALIAAGRELVHVA